MLIWWRGQDTQEHRLYDPPHAWLSPGPPGHISPHWSLLPWWWPDQIRTKCCDRVSRECWVTSTVSRDTGSGVRARPGDAKTNSRTSIHTLFQRFVVFDSKMIYLREKVLFSKWEMVLVSRRRCFLYPVCADCGLMTLNCDLRVRRCCVDGSQVQRPEPGSTTCGGVEQQQRHGVRVLG